MSLPAESHIPTIRTQDELNMQQLDPRQLVRIHRSTIVNLDRIKEIRPHTHGEYILILHDGTRLKVSRSYRDHIRAYLDKIS